MYYYTVAETWGVQSGGTFRRRVRYWQPGKTDLVDTSGYTAQLQLRATRPPGRILLRTMEWNGTGTPPAGTIVVRLEPGDWRITLNGRVTRSLNETVSFEFELVNNDDPDDTIPLVNGVLKVMPQLVVSS